MSDTESDFEPTFEVPKSKSKEKQEKPAKKAAEKPKQAKQAKGKQKGKKKKQSKTKKQSKGKKEEGGDAKAVVKDYMQKQNRPYNLLNVFDNLHGKIKKPQLEEALNQLTEQKNLTCKEFGKNKVYYYNQDLMNVSKESIEELGHNYTTIRAEEQELSERYKQLSDQLKKLLAKRTIEEIRETIKDLKARIQALKDKKESLLSEGSEKIDEAIVVKIENDEARLRKEAAKRKKLTKECLSIWSDIMQKKIPEVAEIMGVEL